MSQRVRSRGLLLLWLLMLASAAGALFEGYHLDLTSKSEHQAASARERDISSALAAMANLRAAEASAIAGGPLQMWNGRADNALSTIGDALARRQTLASPAAKADYDRAAAALDVLVKTDARARAYVKSDQHLIASDVVFQDANQASEKLEAALVSARDADAQVSDEVTGRLRLTRLALFGAGFVVILGGSLLFVRRAGIVAAATEAEPEPMRIIDRRPVEPPTPVAAAAPTPPPEVNLADAAELCVDLARLLDSRDMPTLFERAARVLDAKGLVLWAADSSGALLRPTLAHGYSDKVLARMASLQMDGENATALAYRSMEPQVVNASSATGASAIAVPLMTASGCVGVLSAETRRAKPGKDAVSMTRLIAAQLAALVAPADGGAVKTAGA